MDCILEKKLEMFKKALLEFNQKMSLFSKKDEQKELHNLFQDSEVSAKLLQSVFKETPEALDLGSGNGFPGVPLALFYPKTRLFLCERSQKKAEFLRHVKYLLNLDSVEILNQDIREVKGQFKLILSKATAPLPTVLELLKGKLHDEGRAFLWKYEGWEREKPEVQTGFLIEAFKTYSRVSSPKKGVLLKVSVQSSKKTL